ncbi:aminoglycoside phosphotransferase/kinase family protein [Streptomyces dubilierae]|uniref:Aminoglycoside phosphotransferase n=1 Tax=Streptomyces dubilierae TaxID=3075533 RepID=A0ABU2PMJ3_9ACTN|nr:aminoglycoside phosphotransferase [Streptomyces sp. DSM 41921]MDT0392884.1 aminoglycoside phosphotransferase [Streptomyces sp. DSM 41921]
MPEVAAADAEVREVLGVPPDRAEFEPLPHNPSNGVTAGVWRVGGGGRTAVLKVLTRTKETGVAWAASNDPRHWNFWRREAYVYRSGLARVWEAHGIRAPRLLECADRPDGDVALWLEDVPGTPATVWSPARHVEHVHRLGRAQGAVGAGEDHPWLSRGFLRDHTTDRTTGAELLDDDAAWRHPRIRRHFPPGLRADMVRLHHDRAWFLTVMESLPRALSHLDQWPANVLSGGPGTSVLLDWAFTGDGALGEDLGTYLLDSVLDHFLPADELPGLAKAAYDAYLHGLRASGWRGDEHLVRLGVCASVVKYDRLTALMPARADDEPVAYGGTGTVPADLRYRERGLALAYLAERAAEARVLAPRLGFPPAPSGR